MIGGGGGAGLYSRHRSPPSLQQRDHPGGLSGPVSRRRVALRPDVGRDGDCDRLDRRMGPDLAAAILPTCVGERDLSSRRPAGDAVTSEIRFSIEGRYPHQVWEVEVPLTNGSLASAAEVEELRHAFHDTHEQLFAIRDEDVAGRGRHMACPRALRTSRREPRRRPIHGGRRLLARREGRPTSHRRVVSTRQSIGSSRSTPATAFAGPRSSSRPRQPSSSIRTRRARSHRQGRS